MTSVAVFATEQGWLAFRFGENDKKHLDECINLILTYVSIGSLINRRIADETSIFRLANSRKNSDYF